MKRLRKQLHKEGYTTHKLRYYVVGEYGGQTNRPHYHSILFNLPEHYIRNEHKLQKIWQMGKVQIDEATGSSMAYVCGYVNKQKFMKNLGYLDDRVKEFNFMSNGLGKNFLSKAREKSMKAQLKPYIVTENGQKISLPRYYKEKVFNTEELETLQEQGKLYLENNPIFENETHKIEYIKNQSRQRQRDLATKRRKI